jgi:hypothetical protein
MAIARRKHRPSIGDRGKSHHSTGTLRDLLAELKQIAKATEKADKKAAERKVTNGTCTVDT